MRFYSVIYADTCFDFKFAYIQKYSIKNYLRMK